MNTIFADLNAMTEHGHVRLNIRGSQEDIGLRRSWTRRLGLVE